MPRRKTGTLKYNVCPSSPPFPEPKMEKMSTPWGAGVVVGTTL